MKGADLADRKRNFQLARELNSDGVIYGRFQVVKVEGTENLRLVIKGFIMSGTQGKILAERQITVPVDSAMFRSVDELSDYLAGRINELFVPQAFDGAIRSAMLPGWGQRYMGRETWGYIWGGAFYTSLAVAGSSTVMALVYIEQLETASAGSDYDSTYSNAVLSADIAKYAWLSAAAFYVINVFDIFVADWFSFSTIELPNFSLRHDALRSPYSMPAPQVSAEWRWIREF